MSSADLPFLCDENDPTILTWTEVSYCNPYKGNHFRKSPEGGGTKIGANLGKLTLLGVQIVCPKHLDCKQHLLNTVIVVILIIASLSLTRITLPFLHKLHAVPTIAKLCLPTFPRQIALYSPCRSVGRLVVVTFCYH